MAIHVADVCGEDSCLITKHEEILKKENTKLIGEFVQSIYIPSTRNLTIISIPNQ